MQGTSSQCYKLLESTLTLCRFVYLIPGLQRKARVPHVTFNVRNGPRAEVSGRGEHMETHITRNGRATKILLLLTGQKTCPALYQSDNAGQQTLVSDKDSRIDTLSFRPFPGGDD